MGGYLHDIFFFVPYRMVLLRCMEPVVIQQRDLQLNVVSEPQREVKFCHQKDTPLIPQQSAGYELEPTKLYKYGSRARNRLSHRGAL